MNDPVAELEELIWPAVFIAWPRGSKGMKRKFSHLDLDDMTGPYLAKLHEGNIGVMLGPKSKHLAKDI